MKPGYVVLIIVFVSGIVAIGFYMMKRLDNFLAENQKKITEEDAEKPHDGLRIAFENPVIVSSAAEYLEMLSKAYSDCKFYFFTKILFDTNQLLQRAVGKDELISVTANQLVKLLDRNIIMYPVQGDELETPRIFSVSDEPISEELTSDNERAVASWVLKNNKHAGATTDTLYSVKCLYLSIRVSDHVYGVVGIVIADDPLDAFENSVMLSILGESALAMENEKMPRKKKKRRSMPETNSFVPICSVRFPMIFAHP